MLGGYIDLSSNRLITFSKELIVWNYYEGTLNVKLPNMHTNWIANITVDLESNILYSPSYDGTLGIWKYDSL